MHTPRGPLNGDPIPNHAEEAIATILRRLEDLYEAINGTRPSRPDEPAYVTAVRWMPILADYRFLVLRKREYDEKRALQTERMERQGSLLHEAASRKMRAVKQLRGSLRELLEALDAPPPLLETEVARFVRGAVHTPGCGYLEGGYDESVRCDCGLAAARSILSVAP